MNAQFRRSRLFGLFVTTSLIASACGPIAFSDGSALAIDGIASVAKAEPPVPEVDVPVDDNKIAISEQIQFEHNSARIMPTSHGILDEVASVIKENPQIKKIEVEGHASSEGDDDHNLWLSQRRAKSVMRYLTSSGVEDELISAKGYGEARPVAGNDTADGRERNRRVEFTILEQE